MCCIMQQIAKSKGDFALAAKHRVSVNLSEAEYQELSWLAGKYQVSMAWLSRRAIGDFLERCQQETAQLPFSFGPVERVVSEQDNRE